MGIQDRDWYREHHRERRLAENREIMSPAKRRIASSPMKSAALFVLLCGGVYAVLILISLLLK